jgi:hypothetical protein
MYINFNKVKKREGHNFGNPGTDGRIIFKCILKKQSAKIAFACL